MEQRIQYATTSDGVNIAYSVTGEGDPLVYLPWFPLSHLQAEWQLPELRHWHERLAEGRMLVRFDGRGTGLSGQDVTEFTVDARLLDLEAVVDRLKLEKFALYATLHTGPVAIAYAVRNPDRVSHLVLWCTYALASDWYGSQVVQAVLALADVDWQTFTETGIGTFAAGWGEGEFAHRVALLFQESLTQQAYQAFLPTLKAVDVTHMLPRVSTPTLVLHRRRIAQLGVQVARGLAARIPNARLALLEGQSVYEVFGDTEPIATALDEFLSEGKVAEPLRIPPRLESSAQFFLQISRDLLLSLNAWGTPKLRRRCEATTSSSGRRSGIIEAAKLSILAMGSWPHFRPPRALSSPPSLSRRP